MLPPANTWNTISAPRRHEENKSFGPMFNSYRKYRMMHSPYHKSSQDILLSNGVWGHLRRFIWWKFKQPGVMSSRVLCEISQLKYNLRCIYSFTTPEAILFCGLDNEDSFPPSLFIVEVSHNQPKLSRCKVNNSSERRPEKRVLTSPTSTFGGIETQQYFSEPPWNN